MLYYSTHKQSEPVDFQYALLKGLANDGGLYMPQSIPKLPEDFWHELPSMSLEETGYRVAKSFLGSEIPDQELKRICYDTLSFDMPLVSIDENIRTLELFHGPTMAFKDVGARFMSRLMGFFLSKKQQNLKVIVATSGDTGSAVAAGFFNVPGIEVYVLFPRNKVSPLQQKQITTWGGNIKALEIEGTFDDCQALAKKTLADKELNTKHLITSANSINIARLLPQSFYYFHAAAQLNNTYRPLVFSVPSGNFGNLSAGLLAQKMGLNIHRFVAATNSNDVVPVYFQTARYNPVPSHQTISNAMDVGNPSNYARMMELFGNNHQQFRENIYACSFSDEQTRQAIHHLLNNHQYLPDPHGAVAWLGAREYLEKENNDANIIFLETAHPAKFPETLPLYMKMKGSLPDQLKAIEHKQESFVSLPNDYPELKQLLMYSD
ncbi:MAG: threonine synthase [Bacteroidetes bacterium]|nr:MAG: threonine synthase [Bacteroidota bacterium]